MRPSCTAIHVCPRRSRYSAPAGMRAAVSLHGHSDCSREKLDFLPDLARRIPLIAALFERSMAAYRRKHGQPLNLAECYWRPPLAAAAVIASEREHLEHRLDMPGLVSLTDHDTIEGPRALRAIGESEVPLSFEWSVPYDKSMFHLGVHNMSPTRLDEAMRALAAYTTGAPHRASDALGELLEWLGECPETLVVLNHPYWDLARVGQLRHDSTLLAFLRAHHSRIHALELNGFRTWSENRRALPLAKGFGIPIVGGGDRHGFAPNAIVNLTNARSMAAFAHELRVERVTHCLIFPEYAEPHTARILRNAGHVLKPDYRHHRGQHTWAERVFVTTNGVEQSVASMWDVPLWVSAVVATTRLVGSGVLDSLFELTRSDGHKTLEADCGAEAIFDGVPHLVPGSATAA